MSEPITDKGDSGKEILKKANPIITVKKYPVTNRILLSNLIVLFFLSNIRIIKITVEI